MNDVAGSWWPGRDTNGGGVLTFQPRRAQLAERETMFRFPDGVPSSLYADQIVIDSAADAVAVLAGLEWDAMTPDQRDDARAFAILAATCLHLDGLRLVGYSAAKTAYPHLLPAMTRAGRMSLVDTMMAAIRGAASRCFGVSSPTEHAALVALIRRDEVL